MALFAETFGNPSAGTPLVLLHGFGGVSSCWREIASRLEGRSVLAFDLPGHGRSMTPEPGGAGRMAKALLEEFDRRGLSRVHLCGHSLGGAVAALIALRAPERVVSLTLLAPGGFGPGINGEALASWRDARTKAELVGALQALAAPGFRSSDAFIDRLEEARALAGSAEALASIYRSMFSGDSSTQGVLPVTDLGRLPMPVIVLWGTADAILPVSQTQSLPSHVQVQLLPGAGHMLIEERPAEVVRVLAQV